MFVVIGRRKGDIALIAATFARRHELLLNCLSVGVCPVLQMGAKTSYARIVLVETWSRLENEAMAFDRSGKIVEAIADEGVCSEGPCSCWRHRFR